MDGEVGNSEAAVGDGSGCLIGDAGSAASFVISGTYERRGSAWGITHPIFTSDGKQSATARALERRCSGGAHADMRMPLAIDVSVTRNRALRFCYAAFARINT
jgi:hypothetical protein